MGEWVERIGAQWALWPECKEAYQVKKMAFPLLNKVKVLTHLWLESWLFSAEGP